MRGGWRCAEDAAGFAGAGAARPATPMETTPEHPNHEYTSPRSAQRWAQLRFAVVGPLLAAPPAHGALQAELEKLAARRWRHPTSGA